MQYKTDVTSDI